MSDSRITPKISPYRLSSRLHKRSTVTPSDAYRSPLLSNAQISPKEKNAEHLNITPNAKRPCLENHKSLSKAFVSPVTKSDSQSVIPASQTPTSSLRSTSKRKLSSSFRSPLISSSTLNVDKSPSTTINSVTELQEKHENLKKEIQDLKEQGCDVNQLQWYIDKLHEYNDIKDVAQMVMGRIAEIECVTVKEVHKEFGVNKEDVL